jgi:uncharacterized SAM-binding protein YcdF (DUF218 family)
MQVEMWLRSVPRLEANQQTPASSAPDLGVALADVPVDAVSRDRPFRPSRWCSRQAAPRRRLGWTLAVLLPVTLLAVAGWRGVVLRAIGGYLVVEQPLAPASAIIVLAGQTPLREMEAAELYRTGWAKRVAIVRSVGPAEASVLDEPGPRSPPDWDLRRRVLLDLGVPAEAIVVAVGRAQGTVEELALAWSTLGSDEPVILVTSKYHTRRVQLAWDRLTQGHSRGIVRPASRDSFDPDHWWEERDMAASVAHEYLGLLQLVSSPVLRSVYQLDALRDRGR